MSKTAKSDAALDKLNKESFLHPYTPITTHLEKGPHIISSAKGTRVTDSQGREFLDGMSGLWCVNVGYGREELVQAIAQQAETLCFYHSFASMANEPSILLADRITSITPGSLNKVFFCNSGSEANDTAVKLVWYYNNLRDRPKKKKFISRHGAYHGVTVAAGSLTGLPYVHNAFDLPIAGFLHTSQPYPYRNKPEGATEREYSAQLAQDLDDLITSEGPETVAAFIAEPVMGAGGVIVPPEGYFEAIVPVLRKHDVLFIVDEVICGFGRMGTMFGSDHFGLEPDIMTMAKGLTSGYVPMSACVLSDAFWEVLRDGTSSVHMFAHGYTYTAHPLAAATGLANLDLIERDGLVQNAAEVGAYLQGRLRDDFGHHPMVGEVRGVGLLAAIELVADKETKDNFDASLNVGERLRVLLMEEGLILRPVRDTVVMSPPLILTKAEVDELVEKLAKGLANLTDALTREGHLAGK